MLIRSGVSVDVILTLSPYDVIVIGKFVNRLPTTRDAELIYDLIPQSKLQKS